MRRLWLDLAIAGAPAGSLVFELGAAEMLPRSIANVAALAAGTCTLLDSRLSYVGCAFEHGPSYIAGPQYRWAHVLKGRGKPAVSPARDEPAALAACKRSFYGGTYYGMRIEDSPTAQTFLTVPVTGPGAATSRLAIVRVGESPPAWRERLLLSSAVIGALVAGDEVVDAMSRSASAPVVASAGVADDAAASIAQPFRASPRARPPRARSARMMVSGGSAVEPSELASLAAGGATVCDVRLAGEFRLDGHIDGAVCVPAVAWEHGFYTPSVEFVAEIAEMLDEIGARAAGSELVLCCADGKVSGPACARLAEAGIRARWLRGGLRAWEEEGGELTVDEDGEGALVGAWV